MAVAKERVDILLVQQGLFTSREQAKRAVMAGQILGENEERLDKAGQKIPVTTELHFKGQPLPFVSRGGYKLVKAIETFGMDMTNQIVLDIGSSTGGFTDVSLQNGAKHVYALDVGTNQLAWKLRIDERVTVMENTNFRYAKLADFMEGQPTRATIDVSFISLALILPTLKDILAKGGEVAALIKPQFEAGREFVGKHGIIKDPTVHRKVLEKTLPMMVENGFTVKGLTYSPIKGGQGNIEFLAWLERSDDASIAESVKIDKIIEEAHGQLDQEG
ncbi:TlyA family RNA methyltransferase [Fructobacillus fructosus]|uniref:Contains S4 and FtsJ domains (YqxC) n=1 Tax=Fructobacillus fructosus TaxID=1631 RepID=A0ABN9YUP4_9LACO|nr:TlyA family RNA methyltransferase [Fructobacillus fructosus]MBD9364976.1 TlyA family RNA methyltransferase [Leuconostoc mesenteroides]KRN52558.1 hemolysin A [Fructobacillus fructosus KCTC 3544]MBC9118499.1 TlyA family RNA methyltransferase [Fructobacillus fructosus]MCK8638469.1 TlyA family RNA methyltransferase [Fructobacillus fructosus]CAK1223451.1 Predicted rRNA methylase YqxC [Fructobacillus fructosus]